MKMRKRTQDRGKSNCKFPSTFMDALLILWNTARVRRCFPTQMKRCHDFRHWDFLYYHYSTHMLLLCNTITRVSFVEKYGQILVPPSHFQILWKRIRSFTHQCFHWSHFCWQTLLECDRQRKYCAKRHRLGLVGGLNIYNDGHSAQAATSTRRNTKCVSSLMYSSQFSNLF